MNITKMYLSHYNQSLLFFTGNHSNDIKKILWHHNNICTELVQGMSKKILCNPEINNNKKKADSIKRNGEEDNITEEIKEKFKRKLKAILLQSMKKKKTKTKFQQTRKLSQTKDKHPKMGSRRK